MKPLRQSPRPMAASRNIGLRGACMPGTRDRLRPNIGLVEQRRASTIHLSSIRSGTSLPTFRAEDLSVGRIQPHLGKRDGWAEWVPAAHPCPLEVGEDDFPGLEVVVRGWLCPPLPKDLGVGAVREECDAAGVYVAMEDALLMDPTKCRDRAECEPRYFCVQECWLLRVCRCKWVHMKLAVDPMYPMKNDVRLVVLLDESLPDLRHIA
ncbi:hypothetical protein V8D89_000196 [Ganoderma adspersum]